MCVDEYHSRLFYFNSITNETAGLTVKDVSEAANVVDK